MTIQIPTADLKSAFQTMLTTALGAETSLGQAEQIQVQELMDELYPLVVSETQALMSATNPQVPQTYLAVIQGCVAAAVAKLGLEGLSTQRQVIAGALQSGIQILALVLRAAVVA